LDKAKMYPIEGPDNPSQDKVTFDKSCFICFNLTMTIITK